MVMEKKRFGEVFFYTSGWVAWIIVAAGAGIWFRYKVKRGKDEVYGIGRAIAGRHCIAGIWKR